ncbi:MAG: N-acetylmuramoyl-L-alanine amidase, partial [Bacteroidales bacterium]|nr:N-acetylmuramoyl-L-alanine amidase [Bacteroidales bacterium]
GLDRRGRPANTLNRAQERSLVSLITVLQSIFPQAALHGHNEYSAKECPCFNVSEWWKESQGYIH